MESVGVLLKACLLGTATGVLISLPIGPTSLEAIKRTFFKGYKEGFLVSFGVVCGDAVEMILINFGILGLVSQNKIREGILWIISGIILSIMGYVSFKRDKKGKKVKANKDAKGRRSMPFLAGFIMVLTNPGNYPLWMTTTSTALGLWKGYSIKVYYIFMISILLGIMGWLSILNLLALKGYKKMSVNSSKNISRLLMTVILFIGIGFILYGVCKIII